MAYIVYLKDRHKNPWKAQVKKKGFRTKTAYFPNKEEAKEWSAQIEQELRRTLKGMEPSYDNLMRLTVGDLIGEYLKRVTPDKASAETEIGDLNNFLKYSDFKTRPLIAFTSRDAWEYHHYLEKVYLYNGRHIKPATIDRILVVLRNVWKVAAQKWKGYEKLLVAHNGNVWKDVKPSEVIKDRTRRLRPGELDSIIEACKGCRGDYKEYSPLAIYMALSTGMRLQEIFNLTWADISYDDRSIRIRKSKMDYKRKKNGRTICMPLTVELLLHHIAMTNHVRRGIEIEDYQQPYTNKPTERLFPMTKGQFVQVWPAILQRAGIPFQFRDYKRPGTQEIIKSDEEGLHFHDLRREFKSNARAAKLDDIERNFMTGHETDKDVYIELNEDDKINLLNKLDRYEWGMTRDEMLKTPIEELREGIESEVDRRLAVTARAHFAATMMKLDPNWSKRYERFLKGNNKVVTPTNVIPLRTRSKAS